MKEKIIMQNKIKFLVMDVDGTLTDGKLYLGVEGELLKAFDIKDGYGIKNMLPDYNIIPIIMTARSSKIVENRCKELGIADLYQKVSNKLIKLNEIIEIKSIQDKINYSYQNFAYIGDDLLDLQCMISIKKAGGVVGCPGDAVEKVKQMADYVCYYYGGNGAVREFIEWLTRN